MYVYMQILTKGKRVSSKVILLMKKARNKTKFLHLTNNKNKKDGELEK